LREHSLERLKTVLAEALPQWLGDSAAAVKTGNADDFSS
jgi:hypothetical protein